MIMLRFLNFTSRDGVNKISSDDVLSKEEDKFTRPVMPSKSAISHLLHLTSRPTHYYKQFTADGLQMITNSLCYTPACFYVESGVWDGPLLPIHENVKSVMFFC
ncbi:protein argonaute 5-like [Rutidosis leptorrhynchoides]|uniref:protein argonaute 5-like n=1 Tax=Rutidosis leptorrhynchoides TaxID=125765 RepID=UPI003A9A4A99